MRAITRTAYKKGEKRPDQGRPKGVPNKITRDIKAMIEGALEDAGGRAYLARQADENPAAFMTLVGKILPREIKAEVAATHVIQRLTPEQLRGVIDAVHGK